MIYSDDVMIELRRDFHRIPEPGFEEVKTSARIKKTSGRYASRVLND